MIFKIKTSGSFWVLTLHKCGKNDQKHKTLVKKSLKSKYSTKINFIRCLYPIGSSFKIFSPFHVPMCGIK